MDMPTGVIILLELPVALEPRRLEELRTRLLTELKLRGEDFYVDGPLVPIASGDVGPMPASERADSSWININLWHSYYSPDYPRGEIELFVRCAEWLEANFPTCTVWYGHDIDDENLSPFTLEYRSTLIAHFKKSQA